MHISLDYLTLIGPMLSCTRQRIPMYQVQRRTQIDTLFYTVLWCVFLSSCRIMSVFKIGKLETFWKINLDQNVRIHNNLNCKVLIYKIIFKLQVS